MYYVDIFKHQNVIWQGWVYIFLCMSEHDNSYIMSNKPAKITGVQQTIDGTHPDQVTDGFLRHNST